MIKSSKTVDNSTGMATFSIPLGDGELRDFLNESPRHVEMCGRLVALVTSGVAEANAAAAEAV